jgi:uncharacterized membrane protein HdeD (DUF308 family)
MNAQNELTNELKSGGKSMTFFGIITIILGILAMLAPGITGLSIAILLGIAVVGGGIIRMLWAFQSQSFGKGLLRFAIGVLTVVCGIALLANPLISSGILTIVLVMYFIIDGIFEIVAGFGKNGGTWFVFGGIISVLLGIMMWTQYPLSGAYALGIFLGIKLFFIGLIMITGGSVVRSIANS